MANDFRPGLTLNARQRPWVAVLSRHDEVRKAWSESLSALLPTVDALRDDRDVDWSEYDCVFTDWCPTNFQQRQSKANSKFLEYSWAPRFPAHLNVFTVFGNPRVGAPLREFAGIWPEESGAWVADLPDYVLQVKSHVPGSHVTRVEGLDAALSAVVDASLASTAKARSEHVTYEVGFRKTTSNQAPPDIRPLLLGPSHAPLAVTYPRPSGADVWVLPTDTSDVMGLVRAAFSEWNLQDPKRFPKLPDWENDRTYWTAAEMEVQTRIEALDLGFAEAERKHKNQRTELVEEFEGLRSGSGSARRRILRDDGKALEQAVVEMLLILGFEVQQMDQVNVDSKREDLRVLDPDEPAWTAICEVKGYTRGARIEALRQVDHHATLFAAEMGSVPARWVIVNAQRRQHPNSREVPYGTRQDDVGSLEDTGGLVLDTRALFDAIGLVEDCRADPSKVRTHLRRATGVLVSLSGLDAD